MKATIIALMLLSAAPAYATSQPNNTAPRAAVVERENDKNFGDWGLLGLLGLAGLLGLRRRDDTIKVSRDPRDPRVGL
jgi:hypothetical protein